MVAKLQKNRPIIRYYYNEIQPYVKSMKCMKSKRTTDLSTLLEIEIVNVLSGPFIYPLKSLLNFRYYYFVLLNTISYCHCVNVFEIFKTVINDSFLLCMCFSSSP